MATLDSARSSTCGVILKFITFMSLLCLVLVSVCTSVCERWSYSTQTPATSRQTRMYYKPVNVTDRYIAALSNAWRKNVRIQQQNLYLMKSKEQMTIPKGILEQCSFQCSIKDPQLQTLLSNMMAFSAASILDTLVLYYHNWAKRLRENFYKLEHEFKTLTSQDSFEKGMYIVHRKVYQQRTECEKNHTSKLVRDKNNAPKSYIVNCYSQNETSNSSPKVTLTKSRKRRRKKKPKLTRTRKRLPVYKHRRQSIKSKPLNQKCVSQEALDKTVINLSSKTITNAHKFVFHLGESFAVTPSKTDRDKLLEDVNAWANSLRMGFILSRVVTPTLSEENKEMTIKQHIKEMERNLKIKPAQKKTFSNSGNHALELFISNVKKQIANCPKKPKAPPKNVDKPTLEAIKELKSWDDTVIRIFDKGTGFFILDKKDYISRVETALQDQHTFRKIEDQAGQIQTTISAVKSWILKYVDAPDCPGMTLNYIDWVTPSADNNEPGTNYMNFKAHKPDKNFPGRLISTGCNSYIKNLSILTAEELKRVDLPHCLKDSNELLHRIEQLNKSGVLVGKTIYHVTFDVVNMFPSISKDIGLPSCKNILDKRTTKLFSTGCILEAIEITLDNNLKISNGNMYVQISGTGMGPNNACQYADAALSPLDHKICNSEDITTPQFYGRYRDDIYVAWTDSLEKLNEFLEWLNTYHPNLKFTMSTPSTIGTEFLDLFIYTNGSKIETKTYSKPSDAHSYLLPQSCHPTHIAENIPYGVAHRVFKNCSVKEEYSRSRIEYTEYLEDRNYDNDLINSAFDKVEKLDRNKLINSDSLHKESSERCYPLVCDFNPSLPPVGRILNKNKFILGLDPTLKNVIQPSKVFTSYRGNKTLKETLVPSKLSNDCLSRDVLIDVIPENINNVVEPSGSTTEGGCFHCKSRCKACKLFICETKTAQSFHTEYKVNITERLDYNTIGVCYLVRDKICRRSSVGSTINNFKTRWRNHKSHIKKGVRSCEIACHYNSEFHDLTKEPLNIFDSELSDQLDIIIFEKLDFSKCISQDDRIKVAKDRETFWQQQLMTLECYGGLNKRVASNEIKS